MKLENLIGIQQKKAVTSNTRGMHNTIHDLHHILNTPLIPTLIHPTETKHSHIKTTIWRWMLKDYKLQHTSPEIYPTTNRRTTETILAVRRDICKELKPIPTPQHLRDRITAANLTLHDGSPIIAISAYMPQLHTKDIKILYRYILSWIQQDITSIHPT